jgi:integrase
VRINSAWSSLSEVDPVEPWVNSLSADRRKAYRSILNRFCDFCKSVIPSDKFTPANLLNETREALAKEEDRPPFKDRLKQWQDKLMSERKRPGSVRTYRNVVLSFLRYHVDRIARESGTQLPRGSSTRLLFDVLKQEEVRAMIDKARKPHHKAIIGFLAQTGQRSHILRAVKWGEDGLDWTTWKPYGVVSVSGPLKDRKEKVIPIAAPYKFVVGRDAMDLLDQWPETAKRKAEKTFVFGLSERQIHRIVAETADATGIQEDSQGIPGTILYRVHPDAFPTYWNGRVRDGGVHELQRKFMMGRDVSHEPRERDLFAIDRLLSAYRAAELKVAIFGPPV